MTAKSSNRVSRDEAQSKSLALSKFLDRFTRERKKGYGIVPFVGAGLSVASGIPAIAQLEEYLKFCIYRSLNLSEPSVEFAPAPANFWPAQRHLLSSDKSKLEGRFHRAIKKLIKGELPASQSQKNEILQEAFGASTDWRAALRFLSRVSHKTEKSPLGSRTHTSSTHSFCLSCLVHSQIFPTGCWHSLLICCGLT